MILFNPSRYSAELLDEKSRDLMRRTVEFFEAKGKRKLKKDDREHVWYADFLELVKRERAFARLLTPAAYGGGDPDVRWDTFRNCDFNEITAFYGLHYWYTWQVSILGLGPLWMSENDAIKRRPAALLEEGGIFAFGLSERAHGADLYSTEMSLAPQPDGTYKANGSKYYIGNANEAALVSTFGRLPGGDFVFFAVGTKQKWYELIKNIVNVQSYVAEFALHDYPITEADILSKGQQAWDSALNTVNIGKFNLGWASIGICTHALYEAINHASGRVLYGKPVTDFPHIRQLLTDAYCRLVAMKVFARRASDYMRSASAEDRRYLLYNPMVKMKVTTQGEEVINLLWDVIAAKGFEADTYFEMATRDIRALPKLEGTVHVNMALIIKFIRNYFFNPGRFPEIPRVSEPRDDTFLFNQGPTKGLGKVQFHDYKPVFEANKGLPNVATFIQQIEIFKEMLEKAGPDNVQDMDPTFSLPVGEMFSIVVYGQLILEQAKFDGLDEDILNQIFDFMVRDFAHFGLQIYGNHTTKDEQRAYCTKIMLIKAVPNPEQYNKVWEKYVSVLNGEYAMNE